MMNKNLRSNESGMALVFAIGLLALLLMIGMAFVGNAVNYRRSAENNSGRTQARMFALSAVSRAITSLTLFSQDFAIKNEGKSFPESFDSIYSFAKYDNKDLLEVDDSDSSKKITDALLTADSLLSFPLDSSLISEEEAKKFNKLFADGNWPGGWVFFTNGKENDKRIIGRAAWQVIGLPADIRASAFLRGYLPMDEYDTDYIPNENRWGREIDEVYLDTTAGSPFQSIPVFPGTSVPQNERPDPEEIKYSTYDELYSALGAGTNDYKKRRWIDRWFLYGTGSMWDPEPYTLDAYTDGYYTLARFNISELGNGVDWKDDYGDFDGDGNIDCPDQWYARFRLTPVDFNSVKAITLLTGDSLSNLDGIQDAIDDGENYESFLLGKNLINGLPFLRRIGVKKEVTYKTTPTLLDHAGNEKYDSSFEGSFANIVDFRKQVAANFNDYCDEDGIPTSDFSAKDWLSDAKDYYSDKWDDNPNTMPVFNHPKFTGNEKTPYIYELGMSWGFASIPDNIKQDDGTEKRPEDPVITATYDNATQEYLCKTLQIKAVPLLKLCNIYPFDPDEKVNGKNLYHNFLNDSNLPNKDDFMRAYVEFDTMEVSFKLRKIILRGVKFNYELVNNSTNPVTTVSKTLTCDVVLDLNSIQNPSQGDISLLNDNLKFTGSKWSRFAPVASGASTYIQPIVFGEDDVNNKDGGKPYPMKYPVDASDKMWQRLEPASPVSFKLNLEFDDIFYDPGNGAGLQTKNGVTFYAPNTYDPIKPDNSGQLIPVTSLNELKQALADTQSVNNSITQANDIDIESVQIDYVKGGLQRMMLIGNSASDANIEVGVDYVNELHKTKTNDNLRYDLCVVDKNDVVEGLLTGLYRNYDPRQNLNARDWFSNEKTNIKKIADIHKLSKSDVAEFMCVDSNTGEGLVNSYKANDTYKSAEEYYFSPENNSTMALENKDYEVVKQPAYTATGNISTAVIRNAPMMSPWEIGFIHRGVKWQTINIKKTEDIKFGAHNGWNDPPDPPLTNEPEGFSYTGGDGAILQQIKMSDRIRSYGKININRLRKTAPGFEEYKIGNEAICQALFAELRYAETPADFINNTTRTSNGTFNPEVGSPKVITVSEAADIAESFPYYPNRKEITGRHNFINYVAPGDLNLACAFSNTVKLSQEKTDAAQEEIIGKTINLLSADSLSPTVIKILVVAQSIRDVDGTQVRNAADASDQYDLIGVAGDPDEAVIDSDQIAVKECKFGRFDMTAHKTNHGKNIYFDEITGEVRIFVELHHDTDTGKITIKKIRYL